MLECLFALTHTPFCCIAKYANFGTQRKERRRSASYPNFIVNNIFLKKHFYFKNLFMLTHYNSRYTVCLRFLPQLCLGYHLSITKLNGLSPNFYFNYHQHKSFFITKLNCPSPNSIHLHQIS
jgi:hypothetical protein